MKTQNMQCNIEWNVLSVQQWDEYFKRARRASLLQSYDYARAMAPVLGQKPRWGLIKFNDHPAGLVQIFETGIFKNIIHTVSLDIGPVWFEGYGSAIHEYAFYKTFDAVFPRRMGRKRRILPSTPESPSALAMFKNLSLQRLPNPGYQTIWLDLTQDTETLRSNLKGKWRNQLNKSEKTGTTINWDNEGSMLSFFLKQHALDKIQKKYDGPSLKTLKALADAFTQNKNLLIGQATLNDKVIAGVLFLIHGQSATYQVGWSSQDGRNISAMNLLLWSGVNELKTRTIYDLDLGGVNDITAAGVKKFKEGLGGDHITYAGHYI